jgi:uncharacterized protein (DUF302 family)
MDFQHTVTVDLTYDEAVARVRAELAKQGFGIITEIDLQATLRAKIGVEVEPHVVLGACNPSLAHQALLIDPRVAVLLPCNVTVSTAGGKTHVRVMDPHVMTAFEGTEALKHVADDASGRLRAVLDAVATEPGTA